MPPPAVRVQTFLHLLIFPSTQGKWYEDTVADKHETLSAGLGQGTLQRAFIHFAVILACLLVCSTSVYVANFRLAAKMVKMSIPE